MALAPCIAVRRWLAALFVAALALAQVHGSAHALHGRAASNPHHPCPMHARTVATGQLAPDQDRKAPPTRQLCCHAICVMAAVQLASPQVPVPATSAAAVAPSAEDPVADSVAGRLDRPPKTTWPV